MEVGEKVRRGRSEALLPSAGTSPLRRRPELHFKEHPPEGTGPKVREGRPAKSDTFQHLG